MARVQADLSSIRSGWYVAITGALTVDAGGIAKLWIGR